MTGLWSASVRWGLLIGVSSGVFLHDLGARLFMASHAAAKFVLCSRDAGTESQKSVVLHRDSMHTDTVGKEAGCGIMVYGAQLHRHESFGSCMRLEFLFPSSRESSPLPRAQTVPPMYLMEALWPVAFGIWPADSWECLGWRRPDLSNNWEHEGLVC